MSRKSSRYRLYGLTVESTLDLHCPRQSRSTPGVPDVLLEQGDPAEFESVGTPENGDWFHYRRLPDGSTYLSWTNLFAFLVSPDGRRVRFHRGTQGEDESLTTYLLGQVLSVSLLALGREALHGTAVSTRDGAVGFLGECGQGKSTLGAAFLEQGYPMVTDDLMVLNDGPPGWAVVPGVPRIKLFPRVARKVLGLDLTGPRMNPGTAKLVLALPRSQSLRRPTPLKALYLLADPRAGDGSRVRIEPLTGKHALLAMIRSAFNILEFETGRLANQFQFASRVAQTVPIRKLSYPRRLSSLPAVLDAVLADQP